MATPQQGNILMKFNAVMIVDIKWVAVYQESTHFLSYVKLLFGFGPFRRVAATFSGKVLFGFNLKKLSLSSCPPPPPPPPHRRIEGLPLYNRAPLYPKALIFKVFVQLDQGFSLLVFISPTFSSVCACCCDRNWMYMLCCDTSFYEKSVTVLFGFIYLNTSKGSILFLSLWRYMCA